MRLLCHLLMEKLRNFWQFSNHLGINKDARYHLRLYLADIGEKWGMIGKEIVRAESALPPLFLPCTLEWPKTPHWLGSKISIMYKDFVFIFLITKTNSTHFNWLQGSLYTCGRTLLSSHALITDILPISKLHSNITIHIFWTMKLFSRSTGLQMGNRQSSKSKTKMSGEDAFC